MILTIIVVLLALIGTPLFALFGGIILGATAVVIAIRVR